MGLNHSYFDVLQWEEASEQRQHQMNTRISDMTVEHERQVQQLQRKLEE